MEKTTPENKFIPKKEESGVNSLFETLGSELDFEDKNLLNEDVTPKRTSTEWAILSIDIIFKIAIVATILVTVDVSVRNMDSSEILNSFPLCSYYSMNVENYDNTDCATYSEILSSITTKRDTLEEELGKNLAILIPQKLLIQNTLKSQEIQYILAKTSDSRIPIDEMLKRFTDIRTSGTFKGEEIECTGYSVKENGELSVKCSFLGFSISQSSDKVSTSRTVALAFLEKLRAPDSGFKILEEPKQLEMQAYSNADLGIKSTFTTSTNLSLRLKYSAPNRQ